MGYLKQKEDFQVFIIFELLYKFGIRVGAIAKLKVKDIDHDGIITFNEKNQKKPKRKLSANLLQKIKYLISVYNLKQNDFLFYNNYCNNSNDKRSNFFSLKLNRIIRQSNCFSKEDGEIICAHMFRSTHAIETFQINGLFKAAEELGHSKISTTKNNYLKPEENNLYMKEEEMRFNNFQYKDIFDYEPQKNKYFINKKRKQITKKNNEKK